jgi:hypothetical protein
VVLRRRYIGKNFSENNFSMELGHGINHPKIEGNPQLKKCPEEMIPILVEARNPPWRDPLRTWLQGINTMVEQGREGRKTCSQFRI